MAKGQKGMSGSDKGLAQIERDLRDANRSRVTVTKTPTTLQEQLAAAKEAATFSGRFPTVGVYELAVQSRLRELNVTLGLLAEFGIYVKDWKLEGYGGKIEPSEFARVLKVRMGVY